MYRRPFLAGICLAAAAIALATGRPPTPEVDYDAIEAIPCDGCSPCSDTRLPWRQDPVLASLLATAPWSAVAPQPVTLDVVDWDGGPAYFSAVFTDSVTGLVHPQPSVRTSPDYWFQDQVYRRSGDIQMLEPGTYTVDLRRGPEYLVGRQALTVPAVGGVTLTHTLQRWVHAEAKGYYAGDHHLHGAGCLYNQQSMTGFPPADLLPHVAGEGLDVAEILVWNPSFVSQSAFFSAQPWTGSPPGHLMKYDLEVSGFGSHLQGHYNLLRLSDMQYPGSVGTSGWPTWAQPMLQWAKAQGAVIGTAHSGVGLETSARFLPNYDVPSMKGIGAMEFFVDVTSNLVDFLGVVNSDLLGELNAWYNIQSCGFRTKIAGETDFPCFGRERMGRGRTYVKANVPAGQSLSYDTWVLGLRDGASYVTDGGSHIFDFQINGQELGQNGSEVHVAGSSPVRITATAAAYLPPAAVPFEPSWPGWNIEKARTPNREVFVDVILNGLRVRRVSVIADGREVAIDETLWIHKSSWVALRVLNSSHTNSFYVLVSGQPVRASQNSAQWGEAVADRYWTEKSGLIDPRERPAAQQAYQAAKTAYQQIAASSSIGPYAEAASYGQGCAASGPAPRIGALGSPRIGNLSFAVSLSGASPGVTPLLLLSQHKGAIPLGPCQILLAAPAFGPFGPPTDPTGTTVLPFPIPDVPEFEGLEIFLQWFVPDPLGPSSQPWSVSDGLDVHISSLDSR